MNLSPAQLEELRLRAVAEKERRVSLGIWTGTVRPHVEYRHRPVDWIVAYLGVPEETVRWSMSPEYQACACDTEVCNAKERLRTGGAHVWDGDVDPLVRMMEAVAAGDDVAVEAATGTQKTYSAACLKLWFLACHENSLVVTAAPKSEQLLDQIWMETGRLWPRFKRHFQSAEKLTGMVRMKAGDDDEQAWSAKAFVAGVGADEESATKAQGFHRKDMLIITEETPGMNPAIMTAFDNTRTADHNPQLALGNPDHRHDPLHQFAIQEHVVHIRISALDHPNIVTGRDVVPGAIGKKRLEQRTMKYGKGSRLYQSRIRGISPSEASDALIRREWCELAAAKYAEEEYRDGSPALGVDVAASENGDKAAIARWLGACLTEVEEFQCPDPNALGRRVALEMQDPATPVDPRYVGVDVVGVGAGTVNELKRLGVKVRHISSARRAIPGVDTDALWSETNTDLEGRVTPKGPVVVEAERFDNLRSQVWWRMREDLRMGRVALPMDEALIDELTTPTYATDGGVIRVEKKESIVKRLKRSPNKADAACYGNWVRRRTPLQPKRRKLAQENKESRDFGLERLIARRAKARAAEERRIQRMLKVKARNRRSG